MSRGISYALSLAIALIITLALGALAAYGVMLSQSSMAGAVSEEAAAQERRLRERLSLVYWVGSKLMLSNDGEVPVTIERVFADNVYDVKLAMNPGEKKTLNIPSSDLLVVQTSSGSLITLRGGGGVGGGSEQGGLEIIRAEARRVGESGNVKIDVWVKNVADTAIHSITVVIVGETGETHVEPENWLLDPGETAYDNTVLPISRFGEAYYVRVYGFRVDGGEEVSDAVWLTLQEGGGQP